MADITPTFFNVRYMDEGGTIQGSIIRALYDFEMALYAICNNMDTDDGTAGTDYLANIGTPLRAAMASLRARTPKGGQRTTGTYPFYYVKHMDENGADQEDIIKSLRNFEAALYAICAKIDDDEGTIVADYLSAVGTELRTAMASLRSRTPKKATLTNSTYYNVGYMTESGSSLSDIIMAIRNLELAIHALCTLIDGDVGVVIGTDYLSTVGTYFRTAMAGLKARAPVGGPVSSA